MKVYDDSAECLSTCINAWMLKEVLTHHQYNDSMAINDCWLNAVCIKRCLKQFPKLMLFNLIIICDQSSTANFFDHPIQIDQLSQLIQFQFKFQYQSNLIIHPNPTTQQHTTSQCHFQPSPQKWCGKLMSRSVNVFVCIILRFRLPQLFFYC